MKSLKQRSHQFILNLSVKKQLPLLLLLCSMSMLYPSFAQEPTEQLFRKKLNTALSHIYRETLLQSGRVSIDSIAVNQRQKRVEIHTNLSLSYLPMRENTVRQIYDSIRNHLPAKQKKYRISVFSDGKEISTLVPNFRILQGMRVC